MCSDVIYQYEINIVIAIIMIYLWTKSIKKLPIHPTIQTPIVCMQFSIQGYAATLRSKPFTCTHFKHWQTKTTLWLTKMNVLQVIGGTPKGMTTSDQEKTFKEANIVFVGAVLSVNGDKLVDAYLHMWVAKNLWVTLELSLA